MKLVLRWVDDNGLPPVRTVAYLGNLQAGAVFPGYPKERPRWALFLDGFVFWNRERTLDRCREKLEAAINTWLEKAGLEQSSEAIRQALANGAKPVQRVSPTDIDKLPLFQKSEGRPPRRPARGQISSPTTGKSRPKR